MPSTKNNGKTNSDSSKSKPGANVSKKTNESNKQSAGSTGAASPSARDKVKDMDSKRRSDAESNEL